LFGRTRFGFHAELRSRTGVSGRDCPAARGYIVDANGAAVLTYTGSGDRRLCITGESDARSDRAEPP